MEDLTRIAGCNMKKVTIADVAKHANVSISTVSQYMNQRYEYMSLETRKKITNSVKELNYRPNLVARSLKNKGTQTIGVIVANIMHSFTTQIIHHLEQNLQAHGFNVTVCNASDHPEKEKEHIELLLSKQVDGFIIFPTGDNVELYERLVDSNIPVVFIDRIIKECRVPCVLLNNELASSYAVEQLIAKQKKNLLVVTSSIDQQITPRIERIEGFKKAMAIHQLGVNDYQVIAAPIETLQDRLKQSFEQFHIDGIVAGNDRVLVEVLQFLKDQGLKSKVDVAVIDEVPLAPFYEPPLITIAQPTKEMAEKAVTILMNVKKDGYDQFEKQTYRFDPIYVSSF